MKSQNIALILILSLVSVSFASEQLIQPIQYDAHLVGGYSPWRLTTQEERTFLKEALRKIYSSNFSQYVPD